MDEFSEGNHLVAWTSTDRFLGELANRFLTRGLADHEMALLLLPREELAVLRTFTWRGDGLESLAASGRLRIVPSEDVLARLSASTEGRSETIRAVLGSTIRDAAEAGYSGARILGRVAPLFFERAEDGAALEIEDAVRPFRPQCSVLCLYRTAPLDEPARQFPALRIARAHTHSIVELPDGAVVCDPPPSDPPQEDAG